jgi:hypothetical protein
MKRAVVFALFSLALSMNVSFADVLGVPDGNYEGTGVLHSSMLVPNMSFSSTRSLSNGIIEAHTTAMLFKKFELASVEAKLQVVLNDETHFSMFDLNHLDEDGLPTEAGQGTCDGTSCTFTATVMSGKLTLTETWIPTPEGFKIVNGSQTFKDLKSTYDGVFTLND